MRAFLRCCAVIVLGTGCGGDGAGGSGAVTCEISARAPTRGAVGGSIVGSGAIACTGTGSLSITTCLDYRTSITGSWREAVCQSSSQPAVARLDLEASAGCFNNSRDYRMRVSGAANGQSLAAAESAPAITPTCQ